ncbi:MAG: SufD family Fe-S cluster assembly protein [Bacteroidales bacterium]|nr:SufD family Fe-S cluster assembly protein [Candidatus Cryptobacteroides aphodequi]
MKSVYIIGRDTLPQSISLGEGEQLSLTIVYASALEGAPAEADIPLTVSLDGRGASLDIAGLYICKGESRLRLKVDVRHNACGCTSRQLFKGLVADQAKAVFDGLVYVAHGAQKTSAAQESHAILLSAGAVAENRPQLEIYADDVECSHGATCGQLNDDELFYMRSRGIPEDEARRLQILSFLSPVLSRLPEDLAESIMK